jgi:chromosome partitioning protein
MEGAPLAAFVVSRQIFGTNLASEIQEALESLELPIFKSRTSQRVAYAEALAQGKSVLDTEPDGKASDEIRAIVQELIEWVS